MTSGPGRRSVERIGEDPARVRIGTFENLICWEVLEGVRIEKEK